MADLERFREAKS